MFVKSNVESTASVCSSLYLFAPATQTFLGGGTAALGAGTLWFSSLTRAYFMNGYVTLSS